MKILISMLVMVVAIAVAESALGSIFEISHVKPDFFLLAAILLGMQRGPGSAALWGVMLGLVQDSLSGGVIGMNFITKPVVGAAMGLLRSKMDFANPNTQTLAGLGASLADGLMLAALVNGFHPAKAVSWSLYRIVIPGAVYNALLLPLLVPVGRYFASRLAGLKRRQVKLVQ